MSPAKHLFILLFVLFVPAEACCAGEVRLDSAQTLAVSDALARFKAEGRQLGAYGIWVDTSSDLIQVGLVPNLVAPGTMDAHFSGDPEIQYSYDGTGRVFRSRLLGK